MSNQLIISNVRHEHVPVAFPRMKRFRCKQACICCRKAHVACDSSRPCIRCTRLCLQCVDEIGAEGEIKHEQHHTVGSSRFEDKDNGREVSAEILLDMAKSKPVTAQAAIPAPEIVYNITCSRLPNMMDVIACGYGMYIECLRCWNSVDISQNAFVYQCQKSIKRTLEALHAHQMSPLLTAVNSMCAISEQSDVVRIVCVMMSMNNVLVQFVFIK